MKETPKYPWSLSITDTVISYDTNEKDGLTYKESLHRLTEYGKNEFEIEKELSPTAIFLRQFMNPLIAVLLVATALTFFLGEWVDAGIIGFAILINAVLGFVQEYKAEQAIADLRSYITERTRVVRNGREEEIDSHALVPGDILHLTNGVRVTADARLYKVNNLSVDEAILTGESLPVSKHTTKLQENTILADRLNMVFAGTLVVGGSAYAVVTHTGSHTEVGALAQLSKVTLTEKTPLQVAISRLTKVIIVVISILVGIIFALGIQQQQPLYEMLILSIAIIVGAVPESLPIGLTAVLAIGVERIAKKRGIMRSLTAAETLGSTTLVMTDKTGTLTQAHMELVSITPSDKLESEGFDPEVISKHYSPEQKDVLRLALSNSDVIVEDDTIDPDAWIMSGSALEVNIVRSAARHGIQLKPEDKEGIQLYLPFNSTNKFSVSKISAQFVPKKYRSPAQTYVVVGAPDILLSRSQIDLDTHTTLSNAVSLLANHGRRVLGVGLYIPTKKHTGEIQAKDIVDIIFLGTLNFFDPIRPEVPEALIKMKSYGVDVVMITGDLPGTAKAVARSLGWKINNTAVITGEQMQTITDATLRDMLPHIKIFARVTPADKVRVAQLYQSRGEVVAMTGDGVNDGPALKVANIGIAIGSGSDVAKGVADLVLIDDNFGTIVATIEEGKQMLANIKKIFVYLMANAFDEVVLIGGSMLLGLAMPLSAIQIIWVNLFTGSIPAIAFAFDNQTRIKHGYGTKKFFDGTVLFLVLGIGILSSLALLALYYVLLVNNIPLVTAQSVLFVCFSAYILVIAFSFRNLYAPIWSYSLVENKILLGGVAIGLVLTFSTVYMPFFQTIFGTTALSFPWLLFVIFWLFINILFVECAKLLSLKLFNTQ